MDTNEIDYRLSTCTASWIPMRCILGIYRHKYRLGNVLGHDDKWIRPVLVLRRIGTLHIVLPITSSPYFYKNGKKMLKTAHIQLNANTKKPSFLVLSQIRTLDGRRFIQHMLDKYSKKIHIPHKDIQAIRGKLSTFLQ